MTNIQQFVKYDLWRTTQNELHSGKRIGYNILKTIILVVRGFVSKDLNTRANALTYSLLFAIVPIIAMILAVAKGFGMADMIHDQLNHTFLGETHMINTIMGFVERYLETAQGGAFLGIGLLILIWAVYSFFRGVESSFNDVWNVQESRSILRQLTTYIAILFLIPVLIIVTSGMTIFIHTTLGDTAFLGHLSTHHGDAIMRTTQFVMAWLFFTWMYKAIPNTKVHLIAAIIPGILMGSLFQLLQMLSVYVIMFLGRTSLVYGAFASLPILLTWLQWTCLLIFIGAQMSFAIQNRELFDYERDLETMSRRYKDFITLYLLSVIIHRFESDEDPLTAAELAAKDHLPLRLVNQLLSRMIEVKLIREVYIEGNEEKTYQPAMDTHLITVGMVTDRIEQQGTEEFLRAATPDMQAFWEHFIQLKQEHNTTNSILINEL